MEVLRSRSRLLHLSLLGSNDGWTEVTGCATAAAICTCVPVQNRCGSPQVLPAYGLQDSRNKKRDPKTKSNPNTMCLQITLGEDHGSGHFYLAKNRTFLLCVDIGTPLLRADVTMVAKASQRFLSNIKDSAQMGRGDGGTKNEARPVHPEFAFLQIRVSPFKIRAERRSGANFARRVRGSRGACARWRGPAACAGPWLRSGGYVHG